MNLRLHQIQQIGGTRQAAAVGGQDAMVLRFISLDDKLLPMSDDHPTRRQAIGGLAAASLVTGALTAQGATSTGCFTSAVEMARLIRAKKLSAREALAAHLKQIERVNPKVNAIVTLVPEMAAEAAAKADEMQARNETLGPLHGLPVAHKDLLETRGIRTTFGSPLYKDYIPTEDDHRCRADAARGRDHHRQDQHAGIRRGIADVQQGLRRDAQSLRPDEDVRRILRRRRRRAGLRTRARRQRLRYRRLAAQSRGILQCGRLPAFHRPRTEPESGVRVVHAEHLGMPRAFGGRPRLRAEHDRGARSPRAALHQRTGRTSSRARSTAASKACAWPGSRTWAACPSTRACAPWWMAHRKTFESLGCIVEQAEPDFAPAEISFRMLRAWNSASALRRAAAGTPGRFQGHAEGRDRGRPAPDAARIWRAPRPPTRQIWRRFQAFLEKYEYFVLPTTQLPPFDVNTPYPTEIAGVKFDNYIDWMKSCWYISATGNPAASVPGGFTPEGLPVGVQIVGRDKEDFSVLQMAHAFEQATGFGKKRPAIA